MIRSVFVVRLAICLSVYAGAPALPGGVLLAQEAAARRLNITIIEGEGAVNNIKARVAREPIVQVTDHNRKPVAGAVLTFTLPNSGPSGAFVNGSRFLTVITDQNGRAVATGFHPNTRTGRYQIRVSASFGGLSAAAGITELNVGVAGVAAAHGGLFGLGVPWTVVIIAGVAAGAAFGIVNAVGGGSGPKTTVSVGAPTLP